MGYATVPFEQKYKVLAGPSHHGQTVPVRLKVLYCPGDDPIRHEDLKTSAPIQGFI